MSYEFVRDLSWNFKNESTHGDVEFKREYSSSDSCCAFSSETHWSVIILLSFLYFYTKYESNKASMTSGKYYAKVAGKRNVMHVAAYAN